MERVTLFNTESENVRTSESAFEILRSTESVTTMISSRIIAGRFASEAMIVSVSETILETLLYAESESTNASYNIFEGTFAYESISAIISPKSIIGFLRAFDTNVSVSETDLVEDFNAFDASVRVWESAFVIAKFPIPENSASVCERFAKNPLFIASVSVRVWESESGAIRNVQPLLFPPFVEFVAVHVLAGVAVLLDMEQ